MKKPILSFEQFDGYMKVTYDGTKKGYEKWDNLPIKEKQKMYRMCCT